MNLVRNLENLAVAIAERREAAEALAHDAEQVLKEGALVVEADAQNTTSQSIAEAAKATHLRAQFLALKQQREDELNLINSIHDVLQLTLNCATDARMHWDNIRKAIATDYIEKIEQERAEYGRLVQQRRELEEKLRRAMKTTEGFEYHHISNSVTITRPQGHISTHTREKLLVDKTENKFL